MHFYNCLQCILHVKQCGAQSGSNHVPKAWLLLAALVSWISPGASMSTTEPSRGDAWQLESRGVHVHEEIGLETCQDEGQPMDVICRPPAIHRLQHLAVHTWAEKIKPRAEKAMQVTNADCDSTIIIYARYANMKYV